MGAAEAPQSARRAVLRLLTSRSAPVLHNFSADATPWDASLDAPLASAVRPSPSSEHPQGPTRLEVRMTGERRGVTLAPGSPPLRFGSLLGCYTGVVLGPSEREAKRPSGFEQYVFPLNSTHVVDPTDAFGQVASDSPFEMALVNEPAGLAMPSLSPLNYRFGLCRHRSGELGVAYYAARELVEGEEPSVCYGPTFYRAYTTVCADATLLGRWTLLQERRLRPFAFRTGVRWQV